MACQIHASNSYSSPPTHEEADRQAEDDAVTQAAQRDAEAAASIEHSDELLDEIDSVLEENAAEFLAAFVNKGGQ